MAMSSLLSKLDLGLPQTSGASAQLTPQAKAQVYNTAPKPGKVLGVQQYSSPIGPALPKITTTPTAPSNNNNNTKPSVDMSGIRDVDFYINEFGQRVNIDKEEEERKRIARKEYDDAVASEENQFNQYREGMLSQIPTLERDRQLAEGDLNTSLTNFSNQINAQKERATSGQDTEIAGALSTAQNVQKQNRNVLRALGILNSTAAGELLSKPMNEFDKQRAVVVRETQYRMQDLDNQLNQKMAEGQSQLAQLKNKYADLIGKIQQDVRFSEGDRLQALRQARTALEARYADISSQAYQAKQAVEQQKQALAMNLANVMAYKNPSADPQQILAQAFEYVAPKSETASIYGTEQQKKKLSDQG